LRQVAGGAVGICCQKTSEAAVFVEAGIKDVLITNQVMGEAKLRHLAQLAQKARIGVLVDHEQQVRALAAAAQSHGVTLDVYVEVNVGANRCGVAPGEDAVPLARQIATSSGLRFAGLHCYHGTAQHLRSPQERKAAIAFATQGARSTRDAIEAGGIAVERITGAGTGSFVHELGGGVFNEIQAGSYIFMDRDYADNQRGEGDVAFEHALFVRTTVMSRPTAARAIVDAGLKASAFDSGLPTVFGRPELRFVKAADEHGVIATEDSAALSLGDTLMLVPGHCDPTVNLYDELICVRGDRVEAVWPISARGALL
jgi:D-serine deaminase-like pyridoxal phosphate-dependent protein